MLIKMGRAMESSIERVINNLPENAFYDIRIEFRSTSNSDYSYTPLYLNQFNVIMDGFSKVRDWITLEISIRPQDYMEMYDNSRGLYCNLQILPTHKDKSEPVTPVYSETLIVTIKDKANPRDIFPQNVLSVPAGESPSEHNESFEVKLTLELIEAFVYEMRKCKFTFAVKDVTISDILYGIAQILKFSGTKIVEPDNDKVYPYIIIPPMKEYADVMDFLQSARYLGIYDAGMSFYCSRGKLAVWPTYKGTIPSKKKHLIYRVGTDQFAGMDAYHAYLEDTLHLIASGLFYTKDNADELQETIGSSSIVQHGENIRDLVSITGTGISVAENISVYASNKEGMTENSFNGTFHYSHSNDRAFKSKVGLAATKLVEFEWKHAVPFSFSPSDSCVLYAEDEEGVLSSTDAVCNRALYELRPIDALDRKIYTCKAKVSLVTETTE